MLVSPEGAGGGRRRALRVVSVALVAGAAAAFVLLARSRVLFWTWRRAWAWWCPVAPCSLRAWRPGTAVRNPAAPVGRTETRAAAGTEVTSSSPLTHADWPGEDVCEEPCRSCANTMPVGRPRQRPGPVGVRLLNGRREVDSGDGLRHNRVSGRFAIDLVTAGLRRAVETYAVDRPCRQQVELAIRLCGGLGRPRNGRWMRREDRSPRIAVR